ncbi:sensor histidine kinase [Amycolatopsis taiwanensis]|uniref:sensor histidine kinase n=1 Tax=Amycolatopsis taiwanensis TaxID=342230 RepID=UPI0025555D76|nr:sensor histidine kinase [Amycolatopsis taiwanensis]
MRRPQRSPGERVFDRFYRTDDSRTRTTGGSGLGLAIAHALATTHGGRVTLDTTSGQGCTFASCSPCPPRQGRSDPGIPHPPTPRRRRSRNRSTSGTAPKGVIRTMAESMGRVG